MKPKQGKAEPSRDFAPCRCDYQKKNPPGYSVFRWRGGREPWKWVEKAPTPERAKELAKGWGRVLIVCDGCGSEMVREY